MKVIEPATLLAVCIVSSSCSAEDSFKAHGAGRWYPAGKDEPAKMVDGFLAEKPDAQDKGPMALT